MLQCTHMIPVVCANLVMLWLLICCQKSWQKTSLTKSIRLMKIHSKKFCIFTVVIVLLDRIHIWGYNRSYNREKSCCGQISVSYFCLLPTAAISNSLHIFIFSDEIEARNELYGKNPSGFDYTRYFHFCFNMLNLLIKCIHFAGLRTEDGKLEREISQIKILTKNITCLNMMNHMLFSW